MSGKNGKKKKNPHWFDAAKAQLRQIASLYADAVQEGAESAGAKVREAAADPNRPEEAVTADVLSAVLTGVRRAADRLAETVFDAVRKK